MKTKLSILVPLLLVLMVAVTATVSADSPGGNGAVDYNDPEDMTELIARLADGERLTDDEMEAVERFVAIAEVEVTNTITAISPPGDGDGEEETASDGISGCFNNTAGVVARNYAGIVQWALASSTDWCYDGTYIDGTPNWEVEATANSGLLWEYAGALHESETGGDGDTVHRDYIQGHFKWCIPFAGCTLHKYPTVRKWQYGTGASDYETTNG